MPGTSNSCTLIEGKVFLTGFQSQFRRDHRAKSATLPVAAVLCLILLALLAIVQVAHFHSDPTAADHCPLCISMHSAAPIAAAVAALVLIQIGVSKPILETRAVVRHRFSKLYTRPPPAGR
jgi:hypothetical protein